MTAHALRWDGETAEARFLELAEIATGKHLAREGAVPPAVRALVSALDGQPVALETALRALVVLAQHLGATSSACENEERETHRTTMPAGTLVIGRDVAWVKVPDGSIVSLTARPVLRALVRALVEARTTARGGVLSRDRLVRAVWPGEKSCKRSMGNRLSVALSTLKSLGLRELVTDSQGVRIDPSMCVVHVDAATPSAA